MKMAEVRPAVAGDMPEIRECHAEIEALVGAKMDLPHVLDPAILDYWVAQENGTVIGAMYLEKSVRICFVGTNPKATAAFTAMQEEILERSKVAQVRFVHCQIPAHLPTTADISRHLEKAGYTAEPDLLDHMADLRPPEAA